MGLIVNTLKSASPSRWCRPRSTCRGASRSRCRFPSRIQGETISFQHPKFERENKATGQKSSTFTLSTVDDANRILGDVIQDYIG